MSCITRNREIVIIALVVITALVTLVVAFGFLNRILGGGRDLWMGLLCHSMNGGWVVGTLEPYLLQSNSFELFCAHKWWGCYTSSSRPLASKSHFVKLLQHLIELLYLNIITPAFSLPVIAMQLLKFRINFPEAVFLSYCDWRTSVPKPIGSCRNWYKYTVLEGAVAIWYVISLSNWCP